MKYVLQHKNERVFDCEFDEESKNIISIGKVYDQELIPIGMHLTNGHPGKKSSF